MSIRCIFMIFLWALATNQTYGQIIADFRFDDTSDMPASLLINSVGENAISINPLARSDGEGVYTLKDPQNPDKDQWLDLKVPEGLINGLETIQMEFDFRCQEGFAWLIYAGVNRFRFGHHEDNGGFHVRYFTTADPTKVIESDYVGKLSRGERAIIIFAYNQDLGIAYLIKNGHIIWQTSEEERTPGASLIYNAENEHFSVGSHMDGEGSTHPSLYRFRVYESLCLEVSPPTANNDTLCAPGVARLTATGGQEGQYRWYIGSGERFVRIENEVNSTYITEHIDETQNYYVSIATDECESPLVEVQAIVAPKPVAPQVSYTAPCGPGETTLTIEDPHETYQYFWYAHPDSLPVHKGTSFPVLLSTDSLMYVSSYNGTCESELTAVDLRLKDLPQVDAGEDRTIIKGESIDLLASGNYSSVRWQPHESLQYPDSPTPRISPEFTHTYMVTAVNEEGCESTDTLTVFVIDEFPVPNAFSPNNDGRNDTWQIPNIEKYPDCNLVIFNRWGNQVYSSKGYSQPWDGSHQGRQLPAGTYYYTLNLNNGKKPVQGSVVIIR
jgi:gliding motility-associated-like protein